MNKHGYIWWEIRTDEIRIWGGTYIQDDSKNYSIRASSVADLKWKFKRVIKWIMMEIYNTILIKFVILLYVGKTLQGFVTLNHNSMLLLNRSSYLDLFSYV